RHTLFPYTTLFRSSAMRSKREDYLREPYRDRVKLAKEAARIGWGWEDLLVTFRIAERDARHLVFGDRHGNADRAPPPGAAELQAVLTGAREEEGIPAGSTGRQQRTARGTYTGPAMLRDRTDAGRNNPPSQERTRCERARNGHESAGLV